MKPWASTPNYPAGGSPWSGTPTKANPAYSFITPGTAVAAQELNYLLNQRDIVNIAGVSVPGAGWKQNNTTPLTFADMTGGGWDAINNQFLLCLGNGTGGGPADVCSSAGAGDNDFALVDNSTTFNPGGGANGWFTSAAFDGSHYFATYINPLDHSLHICRCTLGGAWSDVFNTTSLSANHYTEAVLQIRGAKIVVYAAQQNLLEVMVADVGNGGSGNWTNLLGTNANCGSATFFADNGTTIVQFGNTFGQNYQTSNNDPTVWTGRSTSFMNGGTQTPYGVVWSPADACFVLIAADGGTTQIVTYNSVDAITWTQVSAIGSSGAGFIPNGLAVTNAGCLVMTVPFSGGDKIYYSTDAGATWRWAMPRITQPGGSKVLLNKIISNGTQFMALSSTGMRFSHSSGLFLPLS